MSSPKAEGQLQKPQETEEIKKETEDEISKKVLATAEVPGDDSQQRSHKSHTPASPRRPRHDNTLLEPQINLTDPESDDDTYSGNTSGRRTRGAFTPTIAEYDQRRKKRILPPSTNDAFDKERQQSGSASKAEDEYHSEPEENEDVEEEEDRPMLVDPVIVRRYDFAARSVQEFLLNYPDTRDNPKSILNLRFFDNEVAFQPRGIPIDDFHRQAFGKFRFLEEHHGYIQWIFPIREQGLNFFAAPLQRHEACIIQSTTEMQIRLLRSLRVMLDFYGMAMSESNRLIIIRHPDPLICAKQYRNLVESYHNYLRITRIFKSLCELGQEDYVPSILLFILAEQSENRELCNRELRASMDRYWAYCMRKRDAQACVAKAIKWVRDEDGEFNMEVYKKIVERKQSEGVWRFDRLEEGLERRVRERRARGFMGSFSGRLRSLRS